MGPTKGTNMKTEIFNCDWSGVYDLQLPRKSTADLQLRDLINSLLTVRKKQLCVEDRYQ